MQSLSDKDRANLKAILDSAIKIITFTKGKKNAAQFYDDEIVFDAVLMNFIIIGESVSKISTATRTEFHEIPWKKIRAFRNLITHHYFGVNAEEVWQIIKAHIPQLRKDIKNILKIK
jgi:uncharacterized protein with HEPN domain